MQNEESRASLLPSPGPPTGGKVPITDRPDVKEHQIAPDTLPVLSCLRGLQQATLAQRFPANDAAAYLYVVRAVLSEGLLTTVDQRLSKSISDCPVTTVDQRLSTVDQRLSKFDVGSIRSEDVQRIVLECLPR